MKNSDSIKLAKQLINCIRSEKDEQSFIAMINNRDIKGAFICDQNLFMFFTNDEPNDKDLHIFCADRKTVYIDAHLTQDELCDVAVKVRSFLGVEPKGACISYLNWDGSWTIPSCELLRMKSSTLEQIQWTIKHADDSELY